jgi:hypothetical protein
MEDQKISQPRALLKPTVRAQQMPAAYSGYVVAEYDEDGGD